MTTRTASRIRLLTGTALAVGIFTACSATGTTTPAAPGTAAPAPSSAPSSAAMSAPATSAAASSSASSSSASGSSTPASAATLALAMADSSLGSILVDGRGMTLYMYTKDSPNTSVCEGQCLVNWPPLLGQPTKGAGVDDSKLGTMVRKDGRTQATYNGWPLYYWIKDTKAGDTTGQNVQGVWYVLDRDGSPIKK